MSDEESWAFPLDMQPQPEACAFDLDRALEAVVSVATEIPEDAFTASVLGTERAGNGVVVNDSGLVVTIGYLVTEAERVWLFAADGSAVQGDVLLYDFHSGFGLVQALGRLPCAPIEIGSSADVHVGDRVTVASHGGRDHALRSRVVSKREFAGYWEYVLDEAIFTSPAHPFWGGAAVLDQDGRLIGIGSLLVQEARGAGTKSDGNMIVPIDLLPPILEEIQRHGTVQRRARPWLGCYTAEAGDKLVVAGLAPGGPADSAGVRTGDVVLEVAGSPVGDLADFFRTVWSLGDAGATVPLTLWREGETHAVAVKSADRASFLKSPRMH